jgi:hypothetical protein
MRGPHPCGKAFRAPELLVSGARIPLPEGKTTCISLSFPISEPDPSASFEMSVDGLQVNGAASPSIQLTFQQKNSIDTLAVP